MKTMDERQEQIRGKIATQAIVGSIIVLMTIAFLDSFGIVSFLSYVDLSDLMIILCLILITFLSLSLIWHDAYFGLVSGAQMKAIFAIFVTLSLMEDALLIYDILQGDILIHSLFSVGMVNSVAISLWCKRADWKA